MSIDTPPRARQRRLQRDGARPRPDLQELDSRREAQHARERLRAHDGVDGVME
ncbi:MAG TPA: hypothetical protein VHG08_29145 [Longimicrobium sp.]|nr:hypothetical protein [Longimicrobium sp.]